MTSIVIPSTNDISQNTPSPSIVGTPTTPNTARRRQMHLKLLSQGLFRFQDVFWGTGENPTEGVTTLHQVFLRHLAEADSLITIAKARVEVEEFAAGRLEEIAAMAMPKPGDPSTLMPIASGAPSLLFGNSIVGGLTGRLRSQSAVTSNIGSTFSALREWVSSSSTTQLSSTASTAASMIGGGNAVDSGDFGSVPIGRKVDEKDGGNKVEFDASDTTADVIRSDDKSFQKSKPEEKTLEDPASLNPVLNTLKSQMQAAAAVHRRHADTLILSVISPLTAFVDQHRRAMLKKKAEVDSSYKELQKIAFDIPALKEVYMNKCKVAEEEESRFKIDGEKPRPNPLTPITFGARSIGMQEFHDIVNSLKKNLRMRSILTPVGLFEDCFIGEDAIKFLQTKFKVPKSELRHLCQEMLDRRSIAAVVGGKDGKFSKALPYMFGRALLKTGEPPHVRARKDAEVARIEYQATVDSAEHTRGALEFHITDYLVAAQEAEIYRLTVVKESLAALESAQMVAINTSGACWSSSVVGAAAPNNSGGDISMLSADSIHGDASNEPDAAGSIQYPEPPGFVLDSRLQPPSPTDAIEKTAATYRTGHLRQSPFVFESYEQGRTPNQVFGIGMEELAKYTSRSVPDVVVKCVASLRESLETGKSSIDTWIAPNPDLPAVQFLRHEMNKWDGGGRIGGLKRYSPMVVAGVLRLYLMEAPVSLCSYELYEPLKLLYDESNENFDEEARLKSVQSLLSTLSPPHFATLQVLMSYLHALVKPLEASDARIPRLCWSLAPTILRPKQETKETLSDEHPWKFTKDLIENQPFLIGDIDLSQSNLLTRTPSPPLDVEEDEDVVEIGPLGKKWNVGNKRMRGMSLKDLRNEGAMNLANAAANAAAPLNGDCSPAPLATISILEGSIENESVSPTMTIGSPSTPTTPKSGWFSWGTSSSTTSKFPTTATASPLAKKASRQSLIGMAGLMMPNVSTVEAKAEEVATDVEAKRAGDNDSVGKAKEHDTITKKLDEVMNKRTTVTHVQTPERSDSESKEDESVIKREDLATPVTLLNQLETEEIQASKKMMTSIVTHSIDSMPAARPHGNSISTVTSIASIASSVMFGTAAAIAATVSKSSAKTTMPSLPDHAEEEEMYDDDAEEEAALWAQAAAAESMLAKEKNDGKRESNEGDDEGANSEVEFFDGNEVEESEEDESDFKFPSHAQELDEYLQWG
ncbi:hypothetical protein HDU97_008110 [Phlyctochytrium planicorne]|nr:hypothetical protein HDU97_008110 [Phlyctochytrium planicorne]